MLTIQQPVLVVIGNYIQQLFVKCAPRIAKDPRPVPRGFVDTYL